MLGLTRGGGTAANIHVVLVVKLDADAFAVASGDAAASAATQRDGHHAVDVGQHDGNANA